MVWTTYKEKIKRLSQRIVEAQRPIRILDAIKWDPSVEQELRKSKFRDMPSIGPEYYEKLPLAFDPDKKNDELTDIITDIRATLGDQDSIGKLLIQMSEQYIDVVELLRARGTKRFWEQSKKLYGSPKDQLFDEKNTILELGQALYEILNGLEENMPGLT